MDEELMQRQKEELMQRQKEELDSLSAIYGELEDLNNGKKNKPINIRIKLEPARGSACNFQMLVEVYLHVTCPLSYPEELPIIKLEDSKNLSQDTLKKLQEGLEEVALRKIGDESLFDLCDFVRQFLYQHKIDLWKKQERQKEEEENRKLAEKEEQRRKAEELHEQISREINSKRAALTDDSSDESNAADTTTDEGTVVCAHEPVSTITIGSKEIVMGKCLRHFSSHRSIHNGFDKENGKNYTIYEWKLTNFDSNSEQMIKQIRAVEQEFNVIKALKHNNLISYYNISSSIHEDHCIIQTVEELINGLDCYALFSKYEIKIGMKFTQFIAKNVLKALDYLHSKNVVHRDLNSSCVYITQGERVKVTNYATHRRLSDLVENRLNVAYSKRKDILRFGKFILELASGTPASDDDEIKIPQSLPFQLIEFLGKCKDEESQLTAANLLKQGFITCTSFHLDRGDDESDYPHLNFKMLSRNLMRHTSISLDQTRISTEFELIGVLGEGAFGSVHKYRNKLDENFYAIKKIPMNIRSINTIKKIKNEVKLLSLLNHENVVRYFNSWIEEVEEDDKGSASSSDEEQIKVVHEHSELSQYDDIEKLAPPNSRSMMSTTFNRLQSKSSDSESSDEDEIEDNESAGRTNSGKQSESDDIVFQNSGGPSNANDGKTECSSESNKKSRISKRTYMYIQMEFCEKSTLRSAIDDTDLCSNARRVQRHFREILEGLDYIHSQGMIHRDLKPANIFLDKSNRIKIGDFGLATTSFKFKLNDDQTQIDSLKDMAESKTGQVGTFFYVAPEVCTNAKAVYNSKVDVYSLGIILFEMCYKPFSTGMERHAVLVELRKPTVNLPSDYGETLVKQNSIMIRWLLDHDISRRPTVEDILKSEYAPAPIENVELLNYIKYAISNPQTKVYKSLTATLFTQKLPLIKDLSYDFDESKTCFSKSTDINYDLVRKVAEKVFTKHGAKNLFIPHFMPFSHSYTYQNKKKCVKLMTHGGDIVSIPSDLRVNFARYVAWNSVNLFKRYSIERVFNEQKVFGVSPKGLHECAFDIVTPTPGENFLPDGEVLQTAYEILSQLSVFNNENVVIHLNHRLLLKAIMLHLGIDEECHTKILEVFCEHEKKSNDLELNLIRLKLSVPQIQSLTGIFFNKSEPGKIPQIVKAVLNSKVTESKECGTQAIEELSKINSIAKAMGVDFRICVVPGLMYNFQQFSGMICKFLYINTNHKQNKMETLAAGGRYDSMVTHYRNLIREANLTENVTQSAVGISISLDKVAQLLQKQTGDKSRKVADVLVCLEKNWPEHIVVNVLNQLSSLQIHWILFQTNVKEEADEYGENLNIPHIVLLLKNCNENEIVLKSWNVDRSRYREKKYNISDLIEDLNKTIKQDSQTNEVALNRSESKTYVEKPIHDVLNIVFHTAVPSKNHIEREINSKLNEIRRRYQGPIVVLAFNLNIDTIKMLAAYLDFESESSLRKSVKRLDQRHVKEKKLQEVSEFIYEHKTKSNKPFIILISLEDYSYRYI